MRALVATTVLSLLLASTAGAGPIWVGIDTGEELPSDGFLVSISGHYADFHNGRSRRMRDALVPAGDRHWIALGPVNPLLNIGVSVSIYHPEYVSERERSDKTPLLIRPVGFGSFQPRLWREMMQSDREFSNGGPEVAVPQLVGHLQNFLLHYLPALDAAKADTGARDASLRGYLALFDELFEFSSTEAAARFRGSYARRVETDPNYATSLAKQLLEQRAELRELLRRTRAWLSLSRDERVAMRLLMEDMRYGQFVGERLMKSGDLTHVGSFLERHREDREIHREPEVVTSWTNPETRLEYRVRLQDRPSRCADLGITVDLTRVVSADLGDMTNTVKARFCRQASGEWRYGKS